MLVFTETENYPIAFGCAAGKGCTGLLAALLFGALGCPPSRILADVLPTNETFHHRLAINDALNQQAAESERKGGAVATRKR